VATAEAAREPGRVPALLARYLPLRLAASAVVLAAVAAGVGLLAPAQAPVVILAAAGVLATAAQLDWVALADGRHALAGALLLVRPAAFLALLAAAPSLSEPGTVALFFLASWSLAAIASWWRSPAVRPARGRRPGTRQRCPSRPCSGRACRSAPSRSSTTPS
jgi:hypothetical protein